MIKFGNERNYTPKFKFTETKPKKKTLVLDLDGTLIYSRHEGINKSYYKTIPNPDFSFSVGSFILKKSLICDLKNLSRIRNYLI